MTVYTTIANMKGPTGATGPQGLPGVNATPADSAVGGYVGSDGSATNNALKALLVARGTSAVGAPSVPYLELTGNAGSASTLHLSAGSGFTGPYILGIGNDFGSSPGLLVANKAGGVGLYLDNHSAATAQALLAIQSSNAVLADLVANKNGADALLHLRTNTGITPSATQALLLVDDADGEAARFLARGGLQLHRTLTLNSADGSSVAAELLVTDAPSVTGDLRSGMFLTRDALVSKAASGTAGAWFSTRLRSSGAKLSFQAGGASWFGSSASSWSDVLTVTSDAKIGLFGATPTGRQANIPWTDTTNAQLADRVNQLIAVLINLGVIS